MNSGFIAALFIMIIMTAFSFLILHTIAVKATDKIRDNVVNQIKSYDTLIQKKEEELQALKLQIESESNKLVVDKRSDTPGNETLMGVFVTFDAVYRNDDFSKDYRNLKEHFEFNRLEVVTDIYKQYNGRKDQDNNKVLDGLIDKFSLENVYKISAFRSEEQLEIIEELLTKEEMSLLDEFREQSLGFNCLVFYHWLYVQRKIKDRKLLVKTAEDNENYDGIGELLQTQYDKNLCEGIQIYVGNKLYDYGIRNYELIS